MQLTSRRRGNQGGKDINHGLGPRAWPIKDCHGTVLDRYFLSPKISKPHGMDCCGTGIFWDGPKRAMWDYKDPHFFLFHFFF